MKILVDITHPAHAHFFKNAIWKWQERGHNVIITARDKDVAIELLNSFGFDYINLGPAGSGLWGVLSKELLRREWKIYRIVRQFKPKVMVSIGGAFIARVGKLTGTPTIAFADTEHARLSHRISFPFVSAICTGESFKLNLGLRQVRYAGYHELAYLHPHHFEADPIILAEFGISSKEPFFLLRFVSWNAYHDVGQKGFTLEQKRNVVRTLSRYGRVFITAEGNTLPMEFEPYRITVPPHQIHHLLSFAHLYLGEGGTMASEAAVLGIPCVYVNTLSLGYLEEQAQYGLLYHLPNADEALERAIDMVTRPNIRAEWQHKRQQLLRNKIDVTSWMVEFVETYFES